MESENDKSGKASPPRQLFLNGHELPPQCKIQITSQEIAGVAVLSHDKIKQSIEQLVSRGAIARPAMAYDQETDRKGKPLFTSVYLLDKDDSHIVAAKFTPKVTVRLVDLWIELEAKNAAQIPDLGYSDSSALEIARTAINRIDESERLFAEISPKVEALKQMEERKGSTSIRLVAKVLHVPERKFIKWLLLNGWVFRKNGVGALRACSEKRDLGFFDHKPNSSQVMITAKGLVRLAHLVPKMAY